MAGKSMTSLLQVSLGKQGVSTRYRESSLGQILAYRLPGKQVRWLQSVIMVNLAINLSHHRVGIGKIAGERLAEGDMNMALVAFDAGNNAFQVLVIGLLVGTTLLSFIQFARLVTGARVKFVGDGHRDNI